MLPLQLASYLGKVFSHDAIERRELGYNFNHDLEPAWP